MYNNQFYNPYPNRYIPNIPNDMYNNNTNFIQPQVSKQNYLQGKQVDSIDVVKATDVAFDGSISYFPLTDGSAIVTKKLNTDGTSKITIFKPYTEEEPKIEYITREELNKSLDALNFDEIEDIKEDIREIRKEIKKKGD